MAWGSEEELVSLHFRGTRAKAWVYTRMGGTWAQTVRAVLTAWMEGSGWGRAPAVTVMARTWVRCWHTDPLTAWGGGVAGSQEGQVTKVSVLSLEGHGDPVHGWGRLRWSLPNRHYI